MKPKPNHSTKLTLPDLIRWLVDLEAGRWIWTANSICKYVEVGIDTRSGVYSIKDRDGNPITAEQLIYQYTNAEEIQ